MMLDNSRATSLDALLITNGNGDWQLATEIDGEAETSSDRPPTTGVGRLADLIILTIDGSGMRQVYLIEFKNERAIALLQRWIDEYGDDRDPDLDKQIQELNTNRLHLNERC